MEQKGQPAKPSADRDADDAFFVLIECRDEKQQVELLKRFQQEGLKCRALVA